jgi:dipeptidyl aminopeptidase/acylaminoacyl peptidase
MPKIRVKRTLRLLAFTLTVVLFGLLVVLPMGISWIYVNSLVDRECGNRPEPMTQRLSDPDSLEMVTLSPTDDFTLDGWFAAGDNGAGVIILPGAWGGSNTMYQEMEFLHEAGYSVMTYATRSCANPPQRTTLGFVETADLQAALDFMSARPEVDPDRIGVFGHSMGGATAILTAADDTRIQAVIATGNYADLADDVRRDEDRSQGPLEWWIRGWIERFYEWKTGVNIEDASPISVIGRISSRAVFLMHGSVELGNTRGQEQFAAAGDPKELWIVEGAGHGEYARESNFDEYAARSIAFFDEYLLDTPE